MSLRPLTALLILALCGSSVIAQAGRGEAGHGQAGQGNTRDRHGPSERIIVAAAGVSLDQAVAMAERRYQARVVRTEVRDEGGRTVYVLTMLNDSRRWIVKVDAATGEMR